MPIFNLDGNDDSGKSMVEEYLAKTEFNQSLSAISFGNALDITYERQDKGARDGKIKEVVNGIRRVIDKRFSLLEQTLENDYRVIGKVFEGASAAIYRARKEETQEEFAVKVLNNPADYDWFRRSINKVSHIANIKNIIPIYDHRFRSSMSYCILKYIEGDRLSCYIENTSPVSAEFTATVLTKIGDAVSQVRQEKVFVTCFLIFDLKTS